MDTNFENNVNETENDELFFDVSENELSAYVGSKADKFMPKFTKMATTGKKGSFNHAVFWLSFFFTPFVGSFWFFHRKAKKAGTVIASISFLMTAANFYLSYLMMAPIMKFTESFALSLGITGYLPDNSTMNLLATELIQEISPYLALAMLLSVIQFIFTIVIAVYANHYYLKDALKKIREIKANHGDIEHMVYAGGTSAGLWVTLFILNILVTNVATYIISKRILDFLIQLDATYPSLKDNIIKY